MSESRTFDAISKSPSKAKPSVVRPSPEYRPEIETR